MMKTQQMIRRVNRGVAMVWGIHLVLGLGVLLAIACGVAAGYSPVLLAAIPCTIWVLLAINSVREMQMAMQWPAMIESGKLDEVEQMIEKSVGGFSMMRTVRLMSLHHLAVVKMGQSKWAESLELSRATLRHKLPKDQQLERATLVVLAGAAIETKAYGDAFSAIGRLRGMNLTLDEKLSLLSVECAYCGQTGAWQSLASTMVEKSRMAQLMPVMASSRVQAWLSLAAKRTGQAAWSAYLAERCQLLGNVDTLCEEEPLFREVLAGTGDKSTGAGI